MDVRTQVLVNGIWGASGSLPSDHGFQVSLGGNHKGYPPSYFYPYENASVALDDLNRKGNEGEYLTDRLAEEAVNFISQNRQNSFFLYLSHYAVHTPMKAKQKLIQKYEQKAKTYKDSIFTNPVYAAMLESIDESVAKVVAHLKQLNLYDSTILIVASDNGGLVRDSGPFTPPTKNFPLRSGKGFNYEGGIKVPLIIRWPPLLEGGTISEQITSSIDFLPTITGMVDLNYNDKNLDGINLMPNISGNKTEERAIFWHYPHYHELGSKPTSGLQERKMEVH